MKKSIFMLFLASFVLTGYVNADEKLDKIMEEAKNIKKEEIQKSKYKLATRICKLFEENRDFLLANQTKEDVWKHFGFYRSYNVNIESTRIKKYCEDVSKRYKGVSFKECVKSSTESLSDNCSIGLLKTYDAFEKQNFEDVEKICNDIKKNEANDPCSKF